MAFSRGMINNPNVAYHINAKARNYVHNIRSISETELDRIDENTDWGLQTDLEDDEIFYASFSSIPHFPSSWTFYGKSVYGVYISSNGYLVFDSPSDIYIEPGDEGAPTSFPCTHSDFCYMIAFLFADINMAYDSYDNLYLGAAYDGSYIVLVFDDFYYYGGNYGGSVFVKLNSDGSILLAYPNTYLYEPYLIGLNCGIDDKMYYEYSPSSSYLSYIAIEIIPKKSLTWLWILLGVFGGLGITTILVVYFVIIPKQKAKKKLSSDGVDTDNQTNLMESNTTEQIKTKAIDPYGQDNLSSGNDITFAKKPVAPQQKVYQQKATLPLGDRIINSLQEKISQLQSGAKIDLYSLAAYFDCDVEFIYELINDLLRSKRISGAVNHFEGIFIVG
jgi:hypothetical protein